MSASPETRFIANVNKRFAVTDVYFEKMANPYRGGTPDLYYEGDKGILWVEYKWYARQPRKISILDKLSALQIRWLVRAYRNNVKTAVIAGCPEGAMIMTDWSSYENGSSKAHRKFKVPFVPISVDEVAMWIWSQVSEKPYASKTYRRNSDECESE